MTSRKNIAHGLLILELANACNFYKKLIKCGYRRTFKQGIVTSYPWDYYVGHGNEPYRQ
jgi:hypothetical protein